MSEKYFNAYVDSAVGLIHEYVASTLQLKAQLRVANEVIAEKDNTITSLSNEVQSLRTNSNQANQELQAQMHDLQVKLSEAEKAKVDAKYWEDSYHGMANKVSHMDLLTNQFNDMKSQFLAKCREFEDLQRNFNEKCEEIERLKTKPVESDLSNRVSKKVINNKSSASQVAQTKTVEANIDDF